VVIDAHGGNFYQEGQKQFNRLPQDGAL